MQRSSSKTIQRPRETRRGFAVFTLLTFLMVGSSAWALRSLPSSGMVTAVFDGDTILLDTRDRVRYLGIDAPEVSHGEEAPDCMGEEAAKFHSQMVLHKRVLLHYDRERRDDHGRLLAYVHLADGRCANVELLRGGYAFVRRSQEGFARLDEFLGIQREAIRARRGLWGRCPGTPAGEYLGNRRSFVLHVPDCSWGKRTGARNRERFSSRWPAFEQGYRPCRECKP